MKINELRFGNLVQWGDGEIVVDINLMRDFDVYSRNGLEPIPLTEEWLLKFGFEYISKTSYSSNQAKDYKVWSRYNFTFNEIQNRWWHGNLPLEFQPKYVHQLQNLYFAVTGEEL